MRSWPLLLALGLIPVGVLATRARAHAARDEGSLESYLERLRKERDGELERLRPAIETTTKRLGGARSQAEFKKLQQELDALGPEAGLLLLPYLDPGAQGGAPEEQCAREVTAYFQRQHPAGLVDELARAARGASSKGRINALKALGSAPESERAAAHLRSLHAELAGALRGECVRSLARLAPGDPLLVASLGDTHPAVLSAALDALASEPRKAPRREVLALVEDPNRGADVLPELMRYLTVPGQAIEEDTGASLLRFAARADLPTEVRLAVLDGFPRLGLTLAPKIKREFEPITSAGDQAVKESALVAMTLLKDSRARRELVKFFDDQIKENENWPLAYQRRGKILLRIKDYGSAAKDFAKALDLQGDSARLAANRELWIDLARAYVLDDKLSRAADTLQTMEMSADVKRELLADPDFQALVESTKYRKLFD